MTALKRLLYLLPFFIMLNGCATAALSVVAAIAKSRGDGALLLMKFDRTKQEEFRRHSIEVKTLADLAVLETDFKIYVDQRDKALVVFDTLGNGIATARDLIAAGHFDLATILNVYAELRDLLDKLGIKIPPIPGDF